MKLLIALLFVVVVVSAYEHPTFEQWLNQHNKIYGTRAEIEFRRRVYYENIKIIDSLNAEGHAEFRVNKFADISADEFKAKYLTLTPPEPVRPQVNNPFHKEEEINAPSSYDARQHGLVTRIKDQGQCGSCWAFSTEDAVESSWAKAGHSLTSFSTSQLVDCDQYDNGCNGGWPPNAYQYIQEAGGVEKWSDYPYVPYVETCKFQKSKVVGKISGYRQAPSNEDSVAASIAQHGVHSIAINAGWCQFYYGGVADPNYCPASGIDHGVAAVGYGNDDGDYWIIKNSWGASWGESGYARLRKGKNLCGLTYIPTYAVV